MSGLTFTTSRVKSCGFFLCLLGLFLLSGCDVPVAESPLGPQGCARCHEVEIDPAHRIGCTKCHRGDPSGPTLKEAHRGLVSRPAHPEHMEKFCGPCHFQAVETAKTSIHYTLSREIGQIWSRFFPDSDIPTIEELAGKGPPSSPQGLVADLLRRRCLRCHVYYQGDDYPMARRGTGCAACHMRTTTSGPWDHRFYREVPDDRCLSCHYGNFVGWDYYGRFEADYEDEYRAPLFKGGHLKRIYGVEWQEMNPDVHKKLGYKCTACHTHGPCSGSGAKTRICLSCHLNQAEIRKLDEERIGHRPADRELVSCAACHALWAFVDRGRFLTRQDAPDLEFWEFLAVQGSSEVEKAVNGWGNAGQSQEEVGMTDKFTGRFHPGLWFQGFYFRRWAPVVLGETAEGRFEVLRPLLELYLSYVDKDGEVVFENLTPEGMDENPWLGWTPYWPHTIGRADTFRTRQVERWLLRRSRE